MPYIGPTIESSPTEIETLMYEYIQTVYPEWEPREGHLAVLMSEAIAQQIDELLALAAIVPAEIFKYFGTLVGVNPEVPVKATGATTFTMVDNVGYTIPGGTNLQISIGGDEFAYFVTVEDVIVAPGDTATAAGGVLIVATEEGTDASGLAGPIELVDILDYVSTVALVGTTTGGVDAEDEDAYLNRLSDRLQLLADRPILAEDFAIYATEVLDVFRATAIDNYNPVDQTYDNEKMVAIAGIDSTGAALSAGAKTTVKDALEAVRELNFVVNMIDPTFNAITVVATVRAEVGQDPISLETAVEAALVSYLSPITWGASREYGNSRLWVNENKVRYFEIAAVINNVIGVNYIETGTLLINGAAADFTMTGAVPLPAANPTLTVTANAA